MDFLRLIRFPNLLIIVIIQYILQYWLLRPSLIESSVPLLLSHNLFFLLVFSTVIIAATGYIINDIVDVNIDKINKPNKMIVVKIISIKHAWQIYWALFFFGFVISLYVAIRIQNIPLVLIYPTAVALLAAYSYKLKRQAFTGNLIVAIFSALVTGIILFAERESFTQLLEADPEKYRYISLVFYGYMVFAILTSLYREIVKDLEDMEGDKADGCKTIPTVLGTKFSKALAMIFAIATLLFLTPWLYSTFLEKTYLIAAGVCTLVVVPLIYSIIKLWYAMDSKTYHHISSTIKILMAGGIICLLLL